MRVLGISGSPRRGGNTDILVNAALEVVAAEGIETEFLSLADRPIKPCVACRGCMTADTIRCVQEDPAFEGMIERFMAADGILVGSPVYFGSATPQTMALLDRVGYVAPLEVTRTMVNLRPDEKKDNLKLKLIPVGTISGRVLDAGGQPVDAISVEAVQGGRTQRSAMTDDRGQYRIGGLSPGLADSKNCRSLCGS